MQTILEGTRGLSLIVRLHWDRMIHTGAVVGGLAAGAWLCSLYLL